MKCWQRRLLKGIVALCAALVILLAVVIGIFRLFAPLVPGYRAEVERWAERALERPVSIAHMGARWDWYGPEITLEDVKLYSADGKYVVVTAHEIRLGVTLGALLHGTVSAPSRIILIEPQLSVVRDADGHYSLRGFGGENGKWQQMDWHDAVNVAFSQRAEIIVRDGSVTLLDLRRRATPFVFGDLDLKLDNSADSHALSGGLYLPETFGRTLAFSADVEGQAAHPEAWQWHGQVEGEGLDVPRLLAYWPQYRNPFARGVLNLRAELSGNGARLLTVRTHVNARDLKPADAASHGFSTLSGDVDWSRLDDGWRVRGRDILLAQDEVRWPVSHFDLTRRVDAQGESWQGEASFLRMQDLDTLLGWLPPMLRDRLQGVVAFAPQGDVSELSGAARWQKDRLAAWSVQGKFRDLGVRPAHGFPGFSGMDGAIKLDQA
ncbi:MAG TPA: DUF748 domain-containing protein, partial [Gammaproteobacteria bacterium]|nr:DUF748 domain-containing protein [Gammaproteobacteria bacterium]